MENRLYSIKDRATDAFMAPWTAHTDGHAIRMFQDAVNDTQSQMNKHPEDYDLWFVGIFDDQSGMFIGMEGKGPKQIFIGKNALVPRS